MVDRTGGPGIAHGGGAAPGAGACFTARRCGESRSGGGLWGAVAENVVKVSSVHNFCPSPVEVMMDAPDAFEFTSHRESDRNRAMDLTERTLETAGRVGASRVVVHLGSVPMKDFTQQLE